MAISQTNNIGLTNARTNKNDEFYTQLTDIEKELSNYPFKFKGKVVYCPCDTTKSNFFKYFLLNFKRLGLKKLIATSYRPEDADQNPDLNQQAVMATYSGNSETPDCPSFDDITFTVMSDADGDFRSDYCKEIMKQSDIVITNPPFSLFREFIAQIMAFEKQFIILGNMNAITYKEIFPLFIENKMWLGSSISSGDREFQVPEHYPLEAAGTRVDDEGNKYIRVKGVRWFTNMDFTKRHEDLILYKSYNENEYPKYDNIDAINVNATKDIPMDYNGIMGVPISFLDKHNPEQFKIVGNEYTLGVKGGRGYVGGKRLYSRVFIQKIK